MKWNKELFDSKWSSNISNYNEKLLVAKKIASKVKSNDVIGFGSGSSSYLAIIEIAKKINEEKLSIIAIPTSSEIRMLCVSLGIPVATINDLVPDWCFDGADEVDRQGRLIKGRGGAMFNEKLIMSNSPKAYILVDSSKLVDKLCTKFPVPVECVPDAYISVKNRLIELGALAVTLRMAGKSKDGPVITENGNYILDAKFDEISNELEFSLNSICGVLESGLFIGYNIEVISCSK